MKPDFDTKRGKSARHKADRISRSIVLFDLSDFYFEFLFCKPLFLSRDFFSCGQTTLLSFRLTGEDGTFYFPFLCYHCFNAQSGTLLVQFMKVSNMPTIGQMQQ